MYNSTGRGGKEGEPEINRVEKQLMDLETVFNYQNEQQYRSFLYCIFICFFLEVLEVNYFTF